MPASLEFRLEAAEAGTPTKPVLRTLTLHLLDQLFEACEYPALGGIHRRQVHGEGLGDLLGIPTLDGGLPKGLPGGFGKRRANLLRGPAKEPPLILGCPGNLI